MARPAAIAVPLAALLALAAACGGDDADGDGGATDGGSREALTFTDSGQGEQQPPSPDTNPWPFDGPWPFDALPPEAGPDGGPDANLDAAPDAPAPDLLPPDILSPDVLPPDLLPPGPCTQWGDYTCTPSSFIFTCSAYCPGKNPTHHVFCSKSSASCSCVKNGKTTQTCPRSGTGCSACKKAFVCCGF